MATLINNNQTNVVLVNDGVLVNSIPFPLFSIHVGTSAALGGFSTYCVGLQCVEVGQSFFKVTATKMVAFHKPFMITLTCQHPVWKIKHTGGTLMK
jgi:hypothetical protein